MMYLADEELMEGGGRAERGPVLSQVYHPVTVRVPLQLLLHQQLYCPRFQETLGGEHGVISVLCATDSSTLHYMEAIELVV